MLLPQDRRHKSEGGERQQHCIADWTLWPVAAVEFKMMRSVERSESGWICFFGWMARQADGELEDVALEKWTRPGSLDPRVPIGEAKMTNGLSCCRTMDGQRAA